MCFSVTASFVASAGLLSVTAYFLKTTKRVNAYTLFSAALPLIFAIQQAADGFSWLALLQHKPESAHTSGLVYLFIMHLCWPVYFPLLGLINEPKSNYIRRIIFCLFILEGFLFGLYRFIPLIFHYDWLNIEIINHCVSYYNHKRIDFLSIPFSLNVMLYMLSCPFALFVSSHKCLRFFGAVILLSFVISYLFFDYAMLSVWCFFAAIISIMIIKIEPILQKSRL